MQQFYYLVKDKHGSCCRPFVLNAEDSSQWEMGQGEKDKSSNKVMMS